MYTQFFGNYLLTKGYVDQQQLFAAMHKQASTRMKLGTLAIHAGYMTAPEVDSLVIQQTHMDKKFGELAIENGYLTEAQVYELLKTQGPDFLLLGQILVDDGLITNTDLQNIITDYRSENEMYDLDMTLDNRDAVDRLFENFFLSTETELSHEGKMYCELLFNNFIRFVGDDFTLLSMTPCVDFPVERCVSQQVNGNYSVISYINMDDETAVEFASRYVDEPFMEFDEYVQASMEDFLNLHNGLFIVNISNERSIELTISAPEYINDPALFFETPAYDFQVLYSFGIVHFIVQSMDSL